MTVYEKYKRKMERIRKAYEAELVAPKQTAKKKKRNRRTTRRPQHRINPPKISNYGEYLQSEHWKRTRKRKLASTGGKCERCGKAAWQVHHKHYRTLWSERNGDLESVCGGCHEKAHETDRNCLEHLRAIARGA